MPRLRSVVTPVFHGVTVDPGTTHQTMTGWEATSQLGQTGTGFAGVQDAICDMLVDVVGLNRLRLEIKTNAEHRTGTGHAGGGTPYEMENDNADPFDLDPTGFRWDTLDGRVNDVVIPIRNRLIANGESLFLNLCYVGFVGFSPPASFVHDDPDEYAELMLATFQHMDVTFGFVPDSIEISLEPDNSAPFTGTVIGNCMVAAAARLNAAGFFPTFHGPSSTSMADAITRAEDMLAVTGVAALMGEIAYHRYAGVSDGNLGSLADLADTHGIKTAMLEHIGSGVEDLYKDLTLANASSWQQYTAAFYQEGQGDNGGHLVTFTPGTPATNVTMGDRTRYLAQYFKHVRMGAVRIGASTNNPGVRPVAFRNANGKQVVVLHVDAPGPVDVRGLAAGTYGMTLTSASLTADDLGSQVVGGSGSLSVYPRATGVMTIARAA